MGKKCNNLSNPSFKFISEYLFADNCTFIEFHALQKELTARNAQRDELMFSIKVRRPVILHTKLCNSLPLLYFLQCHTQIFFRLQNTHRYYVLHGLL